VEWGGVGGAGDRAIACNLVACYTQKAVEPPQQDGSGLCSSPSAVTVMGSPWSR
jgi:hypothetical protein